MTSKMLLMLSLITFSLGDGKLSGSDSMTEMQRFYYELGKETGIKEGRVEGYEIALQDFKSLVDSQKEKIEAREAAKYFMEEGKITYPEVYKIRKNGTYQVKIVSPKVEREFSAEDLYIAPLTKRSEELFSSDGESVSLSDRGKGKNPNAFDLPPMQSQNMAVRPNTASEIKSDFTLYIPYKSPSIEDYMARVNANHASTENGYVVNFTNNRERMKFCRELTGDETCSKLME